MKTKIIKQSTYVLALSAAMLFSACSSQEAKPELITGECIISGETGPNWACGAYEDKQAYAAVGSAPMSKLGHGFSLREAVANARSSLAQQIETEVKDKVETFMRSTGVSDMEVADKVTAQVSKQVAKQTLNGSKQISYWENKGDDSLYVLVSVSKESINKTTKDSVVSSYKNDDALWQQFQAENALESLEKEFPTNE